LVLIQTRSVGRADFPLFRPSAKCPGRAKKANKASIPRYRQGKAGKKANKASVPRKLRPQILILSKRQVTGAQDE